MKNLKQKKKIITLIYIKILITNKYSLSDVIKFNLFFEKNLLRNIHLRGELLNRKLFDNSEDFLHEN